MLFIIIILKSVYSSQIFGLTLEERLGILFTFIVRLQKNYDYNLNSSNYVHYVIFCIRTHKNSCTRTYSV